jgi:hypothetical protein
MILYLAALTSFTSIKAALLEGDQVQLNVDVQNCDINNIEDAYLVRAQTFLNKPKSSLYEPERSVQRRH